MNHRILAAALPLTVAIVTGCGGSTSTNDAVAVDGGVTDTAITGDSSSLACGGLHGIHCPAGSYCVYPNHNCGAFDNLGTCQVIPSTCSTPDFLEVCGCDGRAYSSDCEAARGAGVDVSSSTACLDAGSTVSCAPAETIITAQVAGAACTTVVRLDSKNAVLGYKLVCGAGIAQTLDSTTAEATAAKDTGYTGGCGESVLGIPTKPSEPSDEVVIVDPDTSNAQCACCGGPGWVVAVSDKTGLTVFGAALALLAAPPTSAVTYPASWDAAANLLPGCTPTSLSSPMDARGWDLTTNHAPVALSQVDVTAITNVIGATGIPVGLRQAAQAVIDALVLRYPAAGGGGAESVVFVNSVVIIP